MSPPGGGRHKPLPKGCVLAPAQGLSKRHVPDTKQTETVGSRQQNTPSTSTEGQESREQQRCAVQQLLHLGLDAQPGGQVPSASSSKTPFLGPQQPDFSSLNTAALQRLSAGRRRTGQISTTPPPRPGCSPENGAGANLQPQGQAASCVDLTHVPAVQQVGPEGGRHIKAGAVRGENMSFPSTFVLLGFSELPRLAPLFAIILACYILTLMGNSSIILLSLVELRLHTPMYFFLGNLSMPDLCVTCTIEPQLPANLWAPDQTMASWGYVTQLHLFSWTACTECALLAMTAIDRYVATCRPLRYSPWVCIKMAAASWSIGLANSLLQVTLTFQLPLCGHVLDHFFCEVPVLLKLACGDTAANDLCLAIGATPFSGMAPLLMLVSYSFIARAVLKSPSAAGRHKALNTCSAHLAVVIMYFGPAIYIYLQPPADNQAKFTAFFYCTVTPLLNPLIYTLRNKDVKTAWNRILRRHRGVESLKAR
ncbi:LOW QUALITY PROTEIN: olfactory receptor 2C1-like [Ctenodactylus gundi]